MSTKEREPSQGDAQYDVEHIKALGIKDLATTSSITS